MYSKNDYRYYLENQLMHSDDFLAHYGVKGMKWRKHKAKVTLEKENDYYGKGLRLDFNKHEHWSDGVGVTYDKKKKKLRMYNTTRTKWDKKADDYVYEKKKKGRVTKERAEDGVAYTIDLSKKKRNKQKNVKFEKIKSYNNDGSSKTIGARVYYEKNKSGGYDKSVGVMKEGKKVTAYAPTKKKNGSQKKGRITKEYNSGFVDYTVDLSKKKRKK